MDRLNGKKVTIEHISYEAENVKLLDINSEALVYEDEDGKHLFRIEDVPLIYRCERDITDKHMGSLKRKLNSRLLSCIFWDPLYHPSLLWGYGG